MKVFQFFLLMGKNIHLFSCIAQANKEIMVPFLDFLGSTLSLKILLEYKTSKFFFDKVKEKRILWTPPAFDYLSTESRGRPSEDYFPLNTKIRASVTTPPAILV